MIVSLDSNSSLILPEDRHTSTDIPIQNNDKNNEYYCYICLDEHLYNEDSYTLNCGHTYCSQCLFRYLEAKILEGCIHPKCFHPIGKFHKKH